MAPCLELEDGQKVSEVDQSLVLGAFVWREVSFVGSFREFASARLYLRIDTKVDYLPGGLLVQAKAQRVEKGIQYVGRAHVYTASRVPLPGGSDRKQPPHHILLPQTMGTLYPELSAGQLSHDA